MGNKTGSRDRPVESELSFRGRPVESELSFRGWPPAALEWLSGIEAHNDRPWFQANRSVYDEAVRGPMEALAAELEEEFGEVRVYRPYRDIRFSKDKRPYKTYIAASAERGGYLSLSTTGLMAAAGQYMLEGQSLTGKVS